MRHFFCIPLLCTISALPVAAQLAVEQKVNDFQNMTALYAKRYAPYEWKKLAFKFDIFAISPWLDRVKASKTDIDFFEICAEYVASLHDTHSSFTAPYRFVADLGIVVDIYDGKLLIEGINRAYLPADRFPFQAGDEVVSVDGKSMDEWIAYFSRFRQWGSPLTTRRSAADAITYRPSSLYARALELGDSATVVVNRANGAMESYTVPWTKTGYPGANIGPVPSPKARPSPSASVSPASRQDSPDYMALLNQMRNWRLPETDPILQGEVLNEETGEVVPRRYLLGIGGRAPVFTLPTGFEQRLGKGTDFHYSGTYSSGGLRIGYLRVPGFSTTATSLRELTQEIAYFQANTDGLIVDVMRNGGGDCYMLSLASYLIPTDNFYFFGQLLRPSLASINNFQNAINATKRSNGPQWVIDLYTTYLTQIQSAYMENRGVTGSIPACSLSFENSPATDNRGAVIAYTKPLIILVDEFSISAADIFPAMMQDNKRGVVVGMPTSGGGGFVSGWPLFYSEASVSNTDSLVVRNHSIVTAEFPEAPYVENIGTRPDIKLDYMTQDNLLNRGKSFVDSFTQIMIDQIKAARP